MRGVHERSAPLRPCGNSNSRISGVGTLGSAERRHAAAPTAGPQDTSHLVDGPHPRRRSPPRRRIGRPGLLGRRGGQAALDVGSRRPVPRLTRRRRSSSGDGGLHEHQQRLGELLSDLQRALDVDLEQDVVARRRGGPPPGARGVPFRSPKTSNALEEPAGVHAAPRTPPGSRSGSRPRRPRPAAGHGWWPRPRARASGRARRSLRTMVPLPTPEGPTMTRSNCQIRRRGRSSGGRAGLRAGCGRARGADGSR